VDYFKVMCADQEMSCALGWACLARCGRMLTIRETRGLLLVGVRILLRQAECNRPKRSISVMGHMKAPTGTWGTYLGVKRLGCEVVHRTPCNATVKNEVMLLYTCFGTCLHGMYRTSFTFLRELFYCLPNCC